MAVLPLFLLLTTSPVQGQVVESPSWQGVWRGTVGSQPVQVCFDHKDYADVGAYYYLRHLGIIHLEAGNQTPGSAMPSWTEGGPSDAHKAAWHLKPMDANHLKGEWSGGENLLPIRLTRLPVELPLQAGDSEGACGSLTFSAPRATSVKLIYGRALVHGVSYTKLTADPGKQFDVTLETFQVMGSTAAVQKINAVLREDIEARPRDAEYLKCTMANLDSLGEDGEYSSITSPQIITPNWLTTEKESSGTCGGAHPSSGSTYQTWDLQKGGLVNLWDWFTAEAVQQSTEGAGTKASFTSVKLTTGFKKLLEEGYARKDAECLDAEKSAEVWDPHLTLKGIAFTPELSDAEAACIDDTVLSFARVTSFLNATGKVRLSSFVSDVRTLK